jgi:adenylosuccinate synthase
LLDDTGEMLRQEGAEFGSTTGRPRRCGWIDLPQLKYTIMLSGVTQLVITKIDVLNKFNELKAANSYSINGQPNSQLPYDIGTTGVTPIYDIFPGWNCALTGIERFEDLPSEARNYLIKLESELEVPITMISTGPDRQSIILKNFRTASIL